MQLYRVSPISQNSRLFGLVFGVLLLVVLAFWQSNFLLRNLLSEPVAISPRGYFFKEPISVSLSSPINGDIRYTLDGSSPGSDSLIYREPVEINKTVVLQTTITDQNGQVLTKPQRQDFFIGTEHTLPIISINLPPASLWDPEIGIYIEGNNNNHRQSGDKWERPAMMRWYEPDQKIGFEHTIGLRLHGNAMRGMAQKSFRIYIQDENGREEKLTYPIFGEEGNLQHSSLILRNGGGDAQFAFMRDRLAAELVEQSDSTLDAQAARPVVLYLNGEYWGLYYVRERFDETYFEEKYRVDPEALAVVDIPLDNGVNRGRAVGDTKQMEGEAALYNRLLSDIRACTHCASYSHVNSLSDINNLLDYLLFEFFFANIDWPYNNTKAWRYRTEIAAPVESQMVPELDGRWRWLLFDLDVSMGGSNDSTERMIKSANGNPFTNFEDHEFPFRNLFFNRPFQKQWTERLAELTQTTLSGDNMTATVDRLAEEIRPEMPRQVERWGGVKASESADLASQAGLDQESAAGQNGQSELVDQEALSHLGSYSAPVPSVASVEEWERRVELLKDYLRARPAAFTQHSQDFFTQANTVTQ